MANRFAKEFKCKKCKGCHKNLEDQNEKLHDVERVTDILYVGDIINTGGGHEAAVTSRSRLEF